MSTLTALLAGLLLVVAYSYLKHQRNQARRYANGCQPPRQYPQKDTTGLGIDLFLDTAKVYAAHSFLPT
jgi:hypothetical protein